MSIAQQIETEIRSLIADRYTQTEIARKMHVKHNQLSVLLAGKRSFGGLRLETVDKMFPNATVNLHGEKPSLNVGDNTAVAVGDGNTVTHTQGDGATVAKYRNALLEAVIKFDGLPPAEKVKVLQLITDFTLEEA